MDGTFLMVQPNNECYEFVVFVGPFKEDDFTSVISLTLKKGASLSEVAGQGIVLKIFLSLAKSEYLLWFQSLATN